MYDVYGTQNNIYMMIEYCDGGDLRKMMKKHHYIMEEALCVDIICQFLDGMKELIDLGKVISTH